jgi:hypothetical protein
MGLLLRNPFRARHEMILNSIRDVPTEQKQHWCDAQINDGKAF